MTTTNTTRQAKCTMCKRLVPSDTEHLAFFEDRSKPKPDDCKHCGYHRVAHDVIALPPAERRPHMRHVPQHEFAPRTERYEFDSFYDGCRGWD